MRPTKNFFAAGIMLGAAACSVAASAAEYVMMRDPNCGCCTKWADHVREALGVDVNVENHDDMAAVKIERGVAPDLASCHTMIVDGYVIEGHVPAEQIARLLNERPEGVAGLAVAGMPIGSPGMEMGGRIQPYDVIAFGPGGRRVFASYPR